MDFSITKVAVLGSGVTGTAVLSYLARNGVSPVSPDDADVVVVSPGIPPSQFPVDPSRCISEIEFAYQLLVRSGRLPAIIGVTGTNGKSTVTAMIAHLAGIPYAGNIGVPLVEWVDRRPDAIVVELSSYQLESIREFRPLVAVLTTLTPDHLERHGAMDAYGAAKSRIFENQGQDDWVIAYDDQAALFQLVSGRKGPVCLVSDSSPMVRQIAEFACRLQADGAAQGLVGHHNHLNAALAIEAVRRLGVSEAQIWDQLATYKPLAHRIEWVGVFQNRVVYDDSKATNPDSSYVAIRSFPGKVVRLLLGGKDKGLGLVTFLTETAAVVPVTYVYGEIAPRVEATVHTLGIASQFLFFDTLDQATDAAFLQSNDGDVILLSPACSSFDQFNDFNHRGDYFKSYVRTHFS